MVKKVKIEEILINNKENQQEKEKAKKRRQIYKE